MFCHLHYSVAYSRVKNKAGDLEAQEARKPPMVELRAYGGDIDAEAEAVV